MADTPVDELTLRELFTTAERLTRELAEHLEQGFLPQVNELRRMTRIDKTVPDFTARHDAHIRVTVQQVLSTDQFTHQLYRKLREYLEGIDRAVTSITSER